MKSLDDFASFRRYLFALAVFTVCAVLCIVPVVSSQEVQVPETPVIRAPVPPGVLPSGRDAGDQVQENRSPLVEFPRRQDRVQQFQDRPQEMFQQPQVAMPDLLMRNPPIVTRVEAFAGRPFGIGRITFRLVGGDELILRTGATLLTDTENRVFYPVMTKTPVRNFLSRITGNRRSEPGNVHEIWFLFKGDEPLNLVLDGSGTAQLPVQVEFAGARDFERFASQWWNEFYGVAERQATEGDYPGIVETYLTSMLSRRIGVANPIGQRDRRDPLRQTFDLLFDVESLRIDTIKRSMAGMMNVAVQDQVVLPPPIEWSPLVVTDLPDGIEIEPMAYSVPSECFYLRFGTWSNQIWFKRLTEEYGGDLTRMVSLRGFQNRIQSKFLNQLAIQSTEFDELFGGNLIDDVAVIGTDLYTSEGAAIGVMLHSTNSDALSRNLRNKRTRFARDHEDEGATIETIEFEGRTIEFLSTPDNRYRSFYVTANDCHLTTTSLAIAKRFIQASAGNRSLAETPEFRFARYQMPLEREDTIFVYLSTPFFQNLLTPRYQIELRRRNQVIAEMQMLELARLTASHEGFEIDDLSLIRNGFLPEGFGQRLDGSTLVPGDENWSDNLRGRRGFFTPIPDIDFDVVSSEEAAWFASRASFFTENVGAVDPMVIAIKRYEHETLADVERVVFDARLAPFGEEKYGWLMKRLGPPIRAEIFGDPGDVVTLQASLAEVNPNRGRGVGNYQIFAAVQDYFDPTIDLRPTSFLHAFRTFREIPSYLGAWPAPGYLDWLPALGGEPDIYGYTYSRLLNLWRLEWGDFSVLSFDRQRLENLKPTLQIVPAERPAHVRLKVRDLSTSRLRDWANAVNYRRSWETSVANARLLNMLTQQFGIEPAISRQVAERLLNVDLVCSLGGEYAVYPMPSGRGVWASDLWPSFSTPVMPVGYTAPFMMWFRGLELEVTKAPSRFAVHGFIDIQRDEDAAAAELPGFNLFRGFENLFGGSDEEEPADGEQNSSDNANPPATNPGGAP